MSLILSNTKGFWKFWLYLPAILLYDIKNKETYSIEKSLLLLDILILWTNKFTRALNIDN